MRWHYGKRLQGTNIYKLCRFSYKYFYRACAYIVTKKSAQVILSQLNHGVLADEWDFLLKDDVDMYFVKLFEHPTDLKGSAIESERSLFYGKSPISRFWDLKFCIRNIKLIFFVVTTFFTGNRKI